MSTTEQTFSFSACGPGSQRRWELTLDWSVGPRTEPAEVCRTLPLPGPRWSMAGWRRRPTREQRAQRSPSRLWPRYYKRGCRWRALETKVPNNMSVRTPSAFVACVCCVMTTEIRCHSSGARLYQTSLCVPFNMCICGACIVTAHYSGARCPSLLVGRGGSAAFPLLLATDFRDRSGARTWPR